MKCLRRVVLLLVLVCSSAYQAGAAGRRLSSQDILVLVPGLQASTFVPVSPGFDYGTCAAFPRPMDLRCDLFAQGGFDAEGRQYAVRYTNSDVNGVLPRTEIWRTSPSGGTEMVASLDPRSNELGAYDDGRIEKIAVDPVQGHLYLVLATTCYPPDQDSCSYGGRAVEIVRITGLRSLVEVLNTAGAGPGGTTTTGGPAASSEFQQRPVRPEDDRTGGRGSR